MNYSLKELEQIEKLAALYMPISDIAVIIDVPAESLRAEIAMKESDAHKAYMRGKTGAKLKLRQQEMTLALVGSSLALENCRKNLMDMEDDE